MISQNPSSSSPHGQPAGCRSSSPNSPATSGPNGQVDRQRWAQLIADGEIPFPVGLSALDEQALVGEVARRRRARLLKYIACQIALSIKRSLASAALENPDDQEQLQPK
ncbi:MAG: hypothetical protein HY290_03660 [Planctomycetia bacterium]|nr:hypothetical protein [Planctomycetia bacterium]